MVDAVVELTLDYPENVPMGTLDELALEVRALLKRRLHEVTGYTRQVNAAVCLG